MKTNELKELALIGLEAQLSEIIDWEPDRESEGVQFGPSWNKVESIILKILELNPSYVIPRSKGLMNHLKESNNKELRKYANAKPLPKVWTMRTGEKILIKDMETSHIRNTMRMIERKITEFNASQLNDDSWRYGQVSTPESQPMYLALHAELQTRKNEKPSARKKTYKSQVLWTDEEIAILQDDMNYDNDY